MSSRRSPITADSLLQLRQLLDRLPPKSPERTTQIAAAAQLYGISVTTAIAPFVWSSDHAQLTAAIMVIPGYSPRLNWSITVN